MVWVRLVGLGGQRYVGVRTTFPHYFLGISGELRFFDVCVPIDYASMVLLVIYVSIT